MQEILRLIPGVDECLLAVLQDPEFETIPAVLLKKGTRAVLEQQRQKILQGQELTPDDWTPQH